MSSRASFGDPRCTLQMGTPGSGWHRVGSPPDLPSLPASLPRATPGAEATLASCPVPVLRALRPFPGCRPPPVVTCSLFRGPGAGAQRPGRQRAPLVQKCGTARAGRGRLGEKPCRQERQDSAWWTEVLEDGRLCANPTGREGPVFVLSQPPAEAPGETARQASRGCTGQRRPEASNVINLLENARMVGQVQQTQDNGAWMLDRGFAGIFAVGAVLRAEGSAGAPRGQGWSVRSAELVRGLERKQRRMCRRDPGVAETLVEAVSMSALECQYQFRFERWNCTLEGRYRASLLKRGFKETAFLYAISSAGLTHALAKACSAGRMERCTCDEAPDLENREAWQWGGCGDNLKDPSVIKAGVETTCKCHGVSGSCTVRTCWRQLAPFHELVHLDDSPSFCLAGRFSPGTAGRRCHREKNCESICCGRGHNTQSRVVTRPCQCQVRWCCYVECRQCTQREEITGSGPGSFRYVELGNPPPVGHTLRVTQGLGGVDQHEKAMKTQPHQLRVLAQVQTSSLSGAHSLLRAQHLLLAIRSRVLLAFGSSGQLAEAEQSLLVATEAAPWHLCGQLRKASEEGPPGPERYGVQVFRLSWPGRERAIPVGSKTWAGLHTKTDDVVRFVQDQGPQKPQVLGQLHPPMEPTDRGPALSPRSRTQACQTTTTFVIRKGHKCTGWCLICTFQRPIKVSFRLLGEVEQRRAAMKKLDEGCGPYNIDRTASEVTRTLMAAPGAEERRFAGVE
ncbi:hypothetical protein E2I00_010794 [Balaenoptera physalus]|uniref:Protein Wnt n=1 Tax=Balaenoptera physalus TaxID=9770 RepID=A0A643C180_BALPH|nr:hypothetical protein E2I00_010794 [Balaenoptera physalus]